MEQQAIAKRQVDAIATIKKKFDDAKKRGHLLTPVTSIDYLPPMYSVAVNEVRLTDSDVYASDDFGKNERAPSKEGLMKISAAAGISWIDSKRIDNMSDPHYCNIQVKGEIKDFDGSLREILGSKEVDFRDGSSQIKGWSEKRIARARQHIQGLAETKAMLRAVRGHLAIKQKYDVSELKQPFFVPKLVFIPDMTDPEIKQAVIDAALHSRGRLYGAPAERTPEDPKVIDIDKIENGNQESSEQEQSAEETQQESAQEQASEDNEDLLCSCECGCKNKLTDKVLSFSMNEYGEALCYSCQPRSKYFNKKKHK